MRTINPGIKGITLLLITILFIGCGPGEPEVINTDFEVLIKSRTYGPGDRYNIPHFSKMEKDGGLHFSDVRVEDLVRACLCDYQNISCNRQSSKVIIKNPNKTLQNFVFIEDVYKGKRKDPAIISQAIMQKLEEHRVISVFERVKDLPRFVIEEVDEPRFKSNIKAKDYRTQTRENCKPKNAYADLKRVATTKDFLAALSGCLGIDVVLSENLQKKSMFKKDVLFDIKTTDDEETLSKQFSKYGLTIKKRLIKSMVLEVNLTPQYINPITKGLHRK